MMTVSSKANLSSNSFVEQKSREFMLSNLASFAFWCCGWLQEGREENAQSAAETQQ